MTASRSDSNCGSTDPTHCKSKCRACSSRYQREYRASVRAATPRPLGPPCVFCGIHQHNPSRLPVYQYALIRPVKIATNVHSNKCVASIAICDACLVEQTIPSPSYVKANGLLSREWPVRGFREDGLRSNYDLTVSVAS